MPKRSGQNSKMKLKNFKETLIEELKDPIFAVTYLKDAIDENDIEGFLLAVRDVIEARGGMGKLAVKIPNLHRVSLYKALSKNGNPLFATMIDVLNAIGIGLKPYLKESSGRAKAA